MHAELATQSSWLWLIIPVVIILFFCLVLPSIRVIGPTEVGLVIKRFSRKKLLTDCPIAFAGEAGYQAQLLMPGWRWKFWVVHKVAKYPWVQVPAGELGVVIAQVGEPLPIGAKSAVYKKEFGNYTDLKNFIAKGGQKGVQRPVLPPGTLAPIHPVAFLVITKANVYGEPISPDIQRMAARERLTPKSFGLNPSQLEVVRIEPLPDPSGKVRDTIGIVTIFEGPPLAAGDIASRIGGFADVEKLEKAGTNDNHLIEVALGTKNHLHNNYQDLQAFLDNGGRIGLQYDPLLYGAYNLNPFLVKVELAFMLVVEQGQAAVIKSYVGLPTEDTSGLEFKFGSLVKPGHRGIWEEPLRTGKYPINPRCYQWEIVPTAILTLNWAEAVSEAHHLDARLESIRAKSREGFEFQIDLQVQIHVPDVKTPRVISMVGTMQNLVNEVLQAAVGNHFRDRLQALPAVKFIETRQAVQEEAFLHIKNKLDEYGVETKGVYIQDVVLPEQIVSVLTAREIANQEIETFKKQREAQDQRIETEKSRGTADMQTSLAKSEVNINIEQNNANAKKAQADGEASYIRQTGEAEAAKTKAIGMANAEAYTAQVNALGQIPTALVNISKELAREKIKIVPDILVAGGDLGAFQGLAAALTKNLQAKSEPKAALPKAGE